MKRKYLKLSTVIIAIVMALIVAGVFASDLTLKKIYDARDKSDIYWNYNKILQQPFKHLQIDGGNITQIIYQPSQKCSVRLASRWWKDKDSTLKLYVKNDTLYIKFIYHYKNDSEKFWLQNEVPIMIFGPELLSVDGNNTNFELQKLKQKNISINLKGKSKLEVETYGREFDTLKVIQGDTSKVVFEMSPDLATSYMMHFKHVYAGIAGYSLLDIGRSTVDNIALKIADSSAVILSGKSLRKLGSPAESALK
jgi:hypothetical protein